MRMTPSHVAFIMDGNRRYARALLKDPSVGHSQGASKLKEVLSWCRDAGIRTVTVYALSLQNFSRPKIEFDFLMRTFTGFAKEQVKPGSEVMRNKVRVRFLGRLDMLPASVRSALSALEEATTDFSDYLLNVAIAYGGREELVDAFRSLAERVRDGELSPVDISEAIVDDALVMADSPDLIIRTGGERRTSNFLLWQSPYSEWCFVDSLWPAFSKEEFDECLSQYASRERRFGA